jgi:hypothetical protein
MKKESLITKDARRALFNTYADRTLSTVSSNLASEVDVDVDDDFNVDDDIDIDVDVDVDVGFGVDLKVNIDTEVF